jgi:aspartyl aminopeptidase
MSDETKQDPARDLAAFIDACPTPYHAAARARERLVAAGFRALDERDEWRVAPGDRGLVVRGGSTIAAFVAGTRPPAEAGFIVIGAHTDSPNLRLKPRPEHAGSGYQQLAIEIYGGVLLHTWLDRDLSVAGRISLRHGRSQLIDVGTPLCRVPNLAIHLQREIGSQGLSLNPEQHLKPIWALGELAAGQSLVNRIAESTAGVTAGDVLGFDLCLYDVQRAAFVGGAGEFIHSARLDNLASCHAALSALLGALQPAAFTRVVVLHDHEEVGSQSASGARSRFLLSMLERLALGHAGGGAQAIQRALARSFLVSADMAHGVHPNYADKHDKQHQPKLGQGPVIKVNVNQSYASDGPSVAVFREACEQAGSKPQYFAAKNDMPCGSTIGPITAARLGMRGVDVGNAMLSMHSCREMAAAGDVPVMIRVLEALLSHPELPGPAD